MKIKLLNKDLVKKLKTVLKEITEETKIEKGINLLYELAIRDTKTHLYNIRFFETLLKIELEKAKRGSSLSLAMFDIDNFKQINSKFGHIKADRILVKIASIIKSSLRKSDVVARFGGEEFIVLLPSTSLNKARRVAERIRKKVRKNLEKQEVTVSAGISEYKKQDNSSTIKERADKALFKAKEKGKNRVEFGD